MNDYVIDDLDVQILKELTRDARQSYREIAGRIGVSAGTVAARINNLEERGVIKGYSAIIDPEKVGYDVIALIELVISEGKLIEIEEKIAQNPHVYAVYDITGTTDAIVIARFKNRRELNTFIKSILAMEYVERTITHVVLGITKEDFKVHI